MEKTVFYSWQSDLPNNENWGFIQKCLEKAIKVIKSDESIEVEPVIDRDTQGVSGSPDISTTILEKISKAGAFVADVSIINSNSETDRKTPNPNVLIELGYALRALSSKCVIPVINIKYGKPETLPFDLRLKRVVTYNSDSQDSKDDLTRKLVAQLQIIFAKTSSVDIPQVVREVRSQAPSRISSTRIFISNLIKEIDKLYPGDGMVNGAPDPEYDEVIYDALNKTKVLIKSFRELVAEVSIFNDLELTKSIFQGFKGLLEKQDHHKGFQGGVTHKSQFDYFKFLSNELFVIMVSIFLKDQKWDLIKYLLESTIAIQTFEGLKNIDYKYFSQNALIFTFRSSRLSSNRASLRYDLLIERRTSEISHEPNSVNEYTSADLLLFVKGESNVVNSTALNLDWRPWSLLDFELPEFVLWAENRDIAQDISNALGLLSIQDLQILLKNKTKGLNAMYTNIFWMNPIPEAIVEKIGTRK